MTSGSPIPPDGFRWVEPPAETGNRSKAMRWWIVGAVIVVAVLVVGGVFAVRWWQHDGDRPDAQAAAPAAPPIGTPKDLLVSFPLDRQPVPGWRLNATDVGLPPGELGSLFATSGRNAYFLTDRGCDGACLNPTSLMYGIDTTTGRALFAPVQLPGVGIVTCHLNGTDTAVCVASSPVPAVQATLPPPTIWVISLNGGEVTYTGPTDLDTPDGPKLVDIGTHEGTTRVIAEVKGKGIYGIGSRGELTWFAPGDGDVFGSLGIASDIPAMPLTAQRAVDPGGLTRVVSIVDGTDLTPSVPPGTTIESPEIYNGGFAYEFEDGSGAAGTLFYDTAGKPVGRQEPDRARLQQNSAMPVLMVGPNLLVYTADGKIVTQIPANDVVSQSQVIGTKFYLYAGGLGNDTRWQQWDLLTGKPGATCTFQLGVSYVASDGNVILTDREPGGDTNAVDPTTCQTLWTVPSTSRLWKVGQNLIQLDADSTSLTSLQAPA